MPYEYQKFTAGTKENLKIMELLLPEVKEKAETILKDHPEYMDYVIYLIEMERFKSNTQRQFWLYVDIIEINDSQILLEEHPEWEKDFKAEFDDCYSRNPLNIKDERTLQCVSTNFAYEAIRANYKKLQAGTYTPNWREEESKKFQEKIRKLDEQLGLNTVKCPYCGSERVEKIGAMSRMLSFSVFGMASGKIGKQWKCNSCKSYF